MSLVLNCVKSHQKETDFFQTALSYGAIAKNVMLPEDRYWDDIFGEGQEAQRKLNKSRVDGEMVPYITENNDAFFSALTLILLPIDGSPLQEEHYHFESVDGKLGKLVLEDSVMMFPADGMHRTAAIKEALAKKRGLGNEEIPVVLIPFSDIDQIRQLFSDLNLHAKVVSKTLGYTFETRDPLALATKRVIEDVDLFHDRVNLKTNSLPAKSPDVITMSTLVDANRELIGALTSAGLVSEAEFKRLKGLEPASNRVGAAAAVLGEIWQAIIDDLPAWADVLSGEATPGALRESYVFAFGLGWRALAAAAAALIKDRTATWKQDLHKCLDKVDWEKGDHWQGIAMIGTRVNNTAPGVKATAGYILSLGGFEETDGEAISTLIENLKASRSTHATIA